MGALFACTSCLGQAEGPLIDAARLGIWLLLAVTACIQGGFVAFFLYLRKRAKLAAGTDPHPPRLRLVRGMRTR